MAEVLSAALVRLGRTIATVSKGLRNALITNQNWLILLLFIADVSFRLPLALSLALQGDSATHALVGEQIVATGRLPDQIPYFVADPGKGWPVAYPQFFFVLLAGGYAVAGEAGLKAISPLLGSLTVVFLFVFARRLYGVKVAALSAIVLMGERHLFIVTIETLMESAVALFTLVAFFEFHYYIEKRRNRDLLGAIAGLALLLSTKQQAYVAILSLVLTTPLLAAFFRLHRERKPAGWSFPFRAALATIIGALLIASPWLVLQIQTAGTVDYPPGLAITHSFMTPKWTVDPDSMQVLNSIRAVVFYVPPEQAAGFLVYLQFYTAPIPFLFVIAITTVVGYLAIALDRTKRIFAILLSANQVTYVFLLWYWALPWRYLVAVAVFSALPAGLGAFRIIELAGKFALRSRIRPVKALESYRVISLSLVLFLVVVPTVVNLEANRNQALIGNQSTTGGIFWGRMEYVKEAGAWIERNTNDSALILGDRWPEVAYYSHRRVIALSELGGHDLPLIYSSWDPAEAKAILNYYGITHIWISQLQIDRSWYEWIPRHGLIDYVDYSPLFLKVYQNPLITIYEVESNTTLPADLPLQLYANRFGDYDDFYVASAVTADSADRWNLTRGVGVTLPPGRLAYMDVWIDPIRTEQVFGRLDVNGSLFLFYRDNSVGNVNVTVRHGPNETYVSAGTFQANGTGNLAVAQIRLANLGASIFPLNRWNAIVFRFDSTGSAVLFTGAAFVAGDVTPSQVQWLTANPLGAYR